MSCPMCEILRFSPQLAGTSISSRTIVPNLWGLGNSCCTVNLIGIKLARHPDPELVRTNYQLATMDISRAKDDEFLLTIKIRVPSFREM